MHNNKGTFAKVLNFQLSIPKWKSEGGGFQPTFAQYSEDELNACLHRIAKEGMEVVDVKTNHYIVNRHNNGGCDEVWVQYTILYK